MCLASTIIFVFSSTSRMPYTTLFMPLLIYLIIKKDASGGVEESRHMHNSLLYSLIGVVAFAFLFLIMAVNSHQEYTSLSPPILFGTVSFNLTNTTSGMQTLDSIILQLGSRLPNETIGTLLVASRDPNALKDIFLVNFDGNGTHPVYTYFEIPLQLDNVTASTQLKLFVSGDHYMTYREIQVQNKST